MLAAASPTEALRYYQHSPMPQDPNQARAWRYGEVLALLRAGQTAAAGERLTALRQEAPDSLLYRVAQVEPWTLGISQPLCPDCCLPLALRHSRVLP